MADAYIKRAPVSTKYVKARLLGSPTGNLSWFASSYLQETDNELNIDVAQWLQNLHKSIQTSRYNATYVTMCDGFAFKCAVGGRPVGVFAMAPTFWSTWTCTSEAYTANNKRLRMHHTMLFVFHELPAQCIPCAPGS